MSDLEKNNFEAYKKAEKKAFEILDEMEKTSARKVDIELALVTAIFELHRGNLPAETIAKIVQTHLETLVQYYDS